MLINSIRTFLMAIFLDSFLQFAIPFVRNTTPPLFTTYASIFSVRLHENRVDWFSLLLSFHSY